MRNRCHNTMQGVRLGALLRGDAYQTGQIMSCSVEGCGDEGVVWKAGKFLPAEPLARAFRRMGWDVDPKKGAHRCPRHAG